MSYRHLCRCHGLLGDVGVHHTALPATRRLWGISGDRCSRRGKPTHAAASRVVLVAALLAVLAGLPLRLLMHEKNAKSEDCEL